MTPQQASLLQSFHPAASFTKILVSAHNTLPRQEHPSPSTKSCAFCMQGSLPPVEQKPGITQTEDILNSILPPRYVSPERHKLCPGAASHGQAACYESMWLLCVASSCMRREWTEDGQLWVQYVSSTPATRLDVINLQEKLDQQLQQRQASLHV